MRLDHVTLRTDELEAMKDFFTEVLGLGVGERPPFPVPPPARPKPLRRGESPLGLVVEVNVPAEA